MVNDPARDNVSRLLDEIPSTNSWLWKCCWGSEGPYGTRIAELSRNILDSEGIYSVFVDGRYGTGKTSFIEQLLLALEAGADQKMANGPEKVETPEAEPSEPPSQQPSETWTGSEDASAGPKRCIIPVVLHMPSLASVRQPVEGLILSAMVEALCPSGKESPSRDPRCRDLIERMEDLWELIAHRQLDDAADDGVIPPKPCRLEHHPATRTLRSSTLAKTIQAMLQGNGEQKRLVVVLDDIDRCPTVDVVHGIMDVLLRFSIPAMPLTFILGASRAVLEKGIDSWMAAHKLQDHGSNMVTASSALEKYVQVTVKLPELDSNYSADKKKQRISGGKEEPDQGCAAVLEKLKLTKCPGDIPPEPTLLDAF
ncbi:MAG: P-loop NTPase fold protein, partial [Desulfovibrionaceae bacterium]